MTTWGSDLLIHSRQNAFIRWLISYCLRKADLITGDAESLCQLAETLSGGRVEIRLLQWGVDLARFSNNPDEEFRKGLRGESEWVFLSTRRLRPLYNIDVILRAFAKARPYLPSSRLVVVGDDTQKKELENLADALSLSNNVLFTGWLPREKVIETLCASDVFLSVPSSDSTALSLLEAFAAGLPVIASDLPANREWIEAGQGGILIPPGDETLLANAMIELARHPIRMQEWGKRNRRIVEERGNRQTEMLKLENWYKELIQQTKK
jgi:glycosyltransferase involved in cell wall biosynthesis